MVIEAPAGSGAIITANAAADIGRDVYVLSGKPNELQYEGSNRLINEGAFLLQSPRQIIENFKFKYNDISIESMDIISGNRLKELYLKAIARYTEKEKNKILSKTKEEKTTKASDKKEIEKFLLGNELIVFKAFQKEEMLSDEIIEKTMLGAAEVIKTLTLLEIKGVIEALPGSRYKLK